VSLRDDFVNAINKSLDFEKWRLYYHNELNDEVLKLRKENIEMRLLLQQIVQDGKLYLMHKKKIKRFFGDEK